MEFVLVTYHRDGGTWWAESDQMPGFSAVGVSFRETSALVREHLADTSTSVDHLIEQLDGGSLLLMPTGSPLPGGGIFITQGEILGNSVSYREEAELVDA